MSTAKNIGERYRTKISDLLNRITEDESERVDEAARILADKIREDGLIYVYGTGGHSYVGSEEFFYRAGGLACISPLFESSLALAAGGQKSTMLERVPGIGDKIIEAHRLREGDVLVITSAYGINAAAIDAALEAKRRGCTVIAITSVDFAEHTPRDFKARHPTRKNLFEIVDVTINQHIPHGETILDIDGFEQRVGGTCNVLQCFAINWLVCRTVELLVAEGFPPPVWRSANVVGGDEYNRSYLDKYTPRVKAL